MKLELNDLKEKHKSDTYTLAELNDLLVYK